MSNFTSDYAQGDAPRNRLQKVGYVVDFNDDFDDMTLSLDKWLPFYLPHWSSRTRSRANVSLQNSHLVLSITADQAPWCPEFDGHIRASTIQTGLYSGPLGSPFGQLCFNPANRVREEQSTQRLYVPQYGFFESRLKAVGSPLNHVALWMIGFEDEPSRSGEICICEIMGGFATPEISRIGYGIHPWADPNLRDEFFEDFIAIDATKFHIYAAEWTPTYVDFFVDNMLTRRIFQSPAYPMQFMLGIYERPETPLGASDREPNHPKQFVVDYFRAYQPIDGYK